LQKIWIITKDSQLTQMKLGNNGFTKSSVFFFFFFFFFKKIRLIQYHIDNCLFSKYNNNKLYLLLTFYVDDILITGENKEIIKVVIMI